MNNFDELFTWIGFLNKEEDKSTTQKALKLSEEVGEVAEAVLSYSDAPGCGYKGKTHKDVLEEAADVIIVAASLALDVGNKEELLDTLSKKCNKWESKQGK